MAERLSKERTQAIRDLSTPSGGWAWITTSELSAPMAAGLLLALKAECEAQHARAEAAESKVAALLLRVETAEREREDARKDVQHLLDTCVPLPEPEEARAQSAALREALEQLDRFGWHVNGMIIGLSDWIDTEGWVKWADVHALLTATPSPQEGQRATIGRRHAFICPECGPTGVDEDGCCRQCGADAQPKPVDGCPCKSCVQLRSQESQPALPPQEPAQPSFPNRKSGQAGTGNAGQGLAALVERWKEEAADDLRRSARHDTDSADRVAYQVSGRTQTQCADELHAYLKVEAPSSQPPAKETT